MVGRVVTGHPSVELLHHVEGRAERPAVLLQPEHARHGYLRVRERSHHAVLQRNVVLGEDAELGEGLEADHHPPPHGLAALVVSQLEDERVAREARVCWAPQLLDPKLLGLRELAREPREQLGAGLFEITSLGLGHAEAGFGRELVFEPHRLSWAEAHGFLDLVPQVFRRALDKDVQVVLVVHLEHLGRLAHADGVGFAQVVVDDNLHPVLLPWWVTAALSYHEPRIESSSPSLHNRAR